ncbi:MAG: hypothetical protein GX562_00755 [Coriobacteriaceae bacterium]|nr:hypothetical protein [Coriobacteriaceae bacterium]
MLRNHIDCHTYPNGSFYKIERGLFVSSPELCFLQIASQMELLKLIELGFELCGSYRQNGIDNEVVANNVDIINDQRPGFRIDKQLTTVRRLRAYISKMERIRGIKKASRAARYLIDHSASPAETMLTMMLALPYMLGGFKLPTPSLNARI